MENNTIRSRMNEKSNDELINIITNDKDEYTDETLELIIDILDERNIEIPLSHNHKKVINTKNIELQTRYHALRTISSFIKFVAYFAFFIVIILSFSITDGSIETILLIAIISIIVLIPYFAFSEIIELFTDLEENTRLTNKLLKKIIDKN